MDEEVSAAIQQSLLPVGDRQESDDDKAIRLSLESYGPIEDRPLVKKMHALVKSTWPSKTAVNVEAQGNCFLESVLVAQNNVANAPISIQAYRTQLGEFYRAHEDDYSKRLQHDFEDINDPNTKTASQRADSISKPYEYFDLIDIHMFEMMTQTSVLLYAMRPVDPSAASTPSISVEETLQEVEMIHGSNSKTVIEMCFHDVKHFTPIVPTDHPQVNYKYQHDVSSNPLEVPHSSTPPPPRRSERFAVAAAAAKVEANPAYVGAQSPTKRKKRRKSSSDLSSSAAGDTESDGEVDLTKGRLDTTSIGLRVKDAINSVAIDLQDDKRTELLKAVMDAFMLSSASSTRTSSPSSSSLLTSVSSSLASSPSRPFISTNLFQTSSVSPRPHVPNLYEDQAFIDLLRSMDHFEATHLEVTTSICTEYNEDDKTDVPLNMVGTVAKRKIKKGAKCGYLHGKIITVAEYEQRKNTTYKVFHDTLRMVPIDAGSMLLVDFDCAASYVNSSSKACFPNTRYKGKKLRHNVKLRRSDTWPGLWYYEAEKVIKQGQELFSLYTKDGVDVTIDDDEEAMEEDEVSDLDDDDDDIVNTQNVHLY